MRIAHERDKPVIVDEAWGAHLAFHPRLPTWAMDAGADVCVTSVHKTGSGLEQGSVFHVQGARISPGDARFVDVSALGVSGYDVADWLRAHHRINLHLSDHRRVSAQFTHADDESTAQRLLHGLRDVGDRADTLRPAPQMSIPAPADLRLEQAMLPRDPSSAGSSRCLASRRGDGSLRR